MAIVPNLAGSTPLDTPIDDKLIYTATFSAVEVSADQDLFAILPPAATRVRIREARFAQYSDVGDAAAEILPVKIIRGFTTAGSGGGLVVPAPVKPFIPAARSIVRVNDTTPASAGSPKTLISDGWNIMAGWWYYPPEEERVWGGLGERIVVYLAADPGDALTVNGTVTFEEFWT